MFDFGNIIKWLKEFLSNEDNRNKIIGYLKKFVEYIKLKKLIKQTVLYFSVFLLLIFIVLYFKVNISFYVKSSIEYMYNYLTDIDNKRAIVGEINKSAINDKSNNVFMSDGFKITQKSNSIKISRLPASVHNNLKKCQIENNDWILQDFDTTKCSFYNDFFVDKKALCKVKTLHKLDFNKWIGNCDILINMINTAKQHRNIATLGIGLCGLKYTQKSSYFWVYIGDSSNDVQEFVKVVFLNEIINVFNIDKKYINQNI